MADDRDAFARAREMIRALCSGEKTWEMNVPARVFEDPDLVLAAAVTLGESLLADRDRLAAENARLREAADGLLKKWAPDEEVPLERWFEEMEPHIDALRAALAARALVEAPR